MPTPGWRPPAHWPPPAPSQRQAPQATPQAGQEEAPQGAPEEAPQARAPDTSPGTPQDAPPPSATTGPWPPPAPGSRPAPWAGHGPPVVPPGGPPTPHSAPAPTGPTDPAGRPLSSWGRRGLALLLDVVVAGIGGLVVALLVTRPYPVYGAGSDTQLRWHSGGLFALFGLLYLGYVGYFTFLGGSRRGQTVGAMAVGLAVRDASGKDQIGAARGLVRGVVIAAFVVPSLFVLVPWILDMLWPLRDPARQAVHDKLARSVVVDVRA